MQSLPFLALNQQTGWLQGARHLPSSNRNARPCAKISLLVIHRAIRQRNGRSLIHSPAAY